MNQAATDYETTIEALSEAETTLMELRTIAGYKAALISLSDAETRLEELRACLPNLVTKVILARDKDGKPTNWQNIVTKDKKIKKQFKSFQHQVETVVDLGVAVNVARKAMLKEIES